jgi:hypothetical protein
VEIVEDTRMPGAVARVKHEIGKILAAAVFFSTGFCLIHVSNRLLTAGSTVELASLSRAIIGGLIVAKVLSIVDLLPFVHAFPGRPLVLNIVWKTWFYVAGGVIFLYVEPFLKDLVKGAGLFASHSRAWQELMMPRTWATLIWVAMLLAVFVSFQELSRVIGKQQFKHMIVGCRGKRASALRFRDSV